MKNLLDKKNIEDVYPMSDIEKGMVYYSLKYPDNAVYHNQTVFQQKDKEFDPVILKKAVALLGKKHPILRTGFNMFGFKEPVQVVFKEITLDIEHYDISGMARQEMEEHVKAFLVKDRKQPFKFTEPEPLWRLRTFALGNGNICFVWICHHAMTDGWSTASLMTELKNTYSKLKMNPEYVPEKLKISYKEFVMEQILEKRKKENIEFWIKELDGYKKLNFPVILDNSKRSKEVKKYERVLDSTFLENLENAARKHNINLKHLCFAAYVYMLSMLSYDNDIVVGIVNTNRPNFEDGDKVLGCFLNTVPVRVRIPANIKWSDYIRMIDKKLVELTKYERLSLYEIVRIIGEDPREENPIFDTLFNFTHFHVYDQIVRDDVDEEGVEGFYFDNYENTNTLLDFTVSTMGGFGVFLSYTAYAISDEDIEKLYIYFEEILNKFFHEPERLAQKTEIFPSEEKENVLYRFNDTKTDYSRDKTVHQLFEEQVERTPDNTAVIGRGQGTGKRDVFLSYRQLNQRSNQLARELRKRGVVHNRFVPVIMDRTVEMVVAVMGIIKAGGAYVPIEPYLPEARISTCISAVKSRYLITSRSHLSMVDRISGNFTELTDIFCLDDIVGLDSVLDGLFKDKVFVCSEEIQENKGETPKPSAAAEDIAYVIFTSGTTGTPKGVVEQHRPVINILEWVNNSFHVNSLDKQLFITSLSFDLSVYDIFGLLAAGGSVRVVDTDDLKSPERLLDIIFEEGITFWDSAPAALQQLIPYIQQLNDGTRSYPNKSRLRLAFLSGDWIPLTMPDILKEAFEGVEVIGLGGGTEATIWSNYYPIGEVKSYWRSIPYGKPIQNARYYILDQYLNPSPIGVPGDLYIGGECLAMGYINDEALTAKKFLDNPYAPGEKIYRTGDMSRWFADGNMEFLGRLDNQVKIRGYRIELGEIESQLLKHDDIKEAVVLALGEIKSDRYLCAYYVAERQLTAVQLKEYLSDALPEYMTPPYFVQLEKMPVTPNGKLDRKGFPEPEAGAAADLYVPPRDAMEEKLVAIWAEILAKKKETIGIQSNFFDMGGHSLTATLMIARIRKELNVNVPLGEVFITPTVEGLVRYVRGAEEYIYQSIQPVEDREYYPLSSAQMRMFLLNRLKGDETSDNTPFVMMVEGNLDKLHFENVVRQLIYRHESLRTSFGMVEDTPVQRVHKEVDFEIEHYDLSVGGSDSEERRRQLITNFIRPFDLGRAPLLRVGLVKLAEQQYILIYDLHHIINDDVSSEIFMKEFVVLYGRGELSPLQIQYRDFAMWQYNRLQAGVAGKQEDYWLGAFSGELPVLNMPTDYPRPAVQSFEGQSLEYDFGADVSGRIKHLVEETGTTLYMVLLAIYNILLSKYTGQEDIIVGTPGVGRPFAELENLIGMFANTMAMRNYPNGEKTFMEFLEEVKINSLKAFENQDYQFEELIRKLGIVPDPSRNPLFDIMITVVLEANINVYKEGSVRELKDMVIRPYSFDEQITQFDIIIHAFDLGEIVGFYLRYSTRLFKKETIETFLGHYEEVAEAVTADPLMKLKDIKISQDFSDAASSILEEAESSFTF